MKKTEAKVLMNRIDYLAPYISGAERTVLEAMRKDLENFTGASIDKIRITDPDIPEQDMFSVPLGDGKELVAQSNADDQYHEIFVYLKKDDVMWQDLAVVGEAYTYDSDNNVVPIKSEYNIKVYGDSKYEDYTQEFRVGEFFERNDDYKDIEDGIERWLSVISNCSNCRLVSKAYGDNEIICACEEDGDKFSLTAKCSDGRFILINKDGSDVIRDFKDEGVLSLTEMDFISFGYSQNS